MARVKFDINKAPHERIPKKTSIGWSSEMSSMNKHKKRSYKRRTEVGCNEVSEKHICCNANQKYVGIIWKFYWRIRISELTARLTSLETSREK